MSYSWEAVTALLPTLSSSKKQNIQNKFAKREIESNKKVHKKKK
jgi:hypothetical protein